MKHLIIAALCACQALAYAQETGKRELIQELLHLQQPVVESLSRKVVEQPAIQLMHAVGATLRNSTPPERRQDVKKTVDTAVKAYVEECVPLLRARAINLAPSTIGTTLEENFDEDELKQIVAWLESPVNKKFQRLGQGMYSDFVRKLVVEAGPLLDPKFQQLKQNVRAAFEVAPAASAASGVASAVAPAPASAPGQ
ncbi:MAG: DUF2059 domain-containing protein [Burkholderiaceae bacterium]|nr:DUF2059 domain-containing protein [Burkholderiaceae bacterium]MDH3461195.1 DUF2059 domain-containing protein [Burkholderiaceae bacterium]